MFFFKGTHRFHQADFARQHLLRELLQHAQTLFESSTADDQLTDEVQQPLQPIPADANYFAVLARGVLHFRIPRLCLLRFRLIAYFIDGGGRSRLDHRRCGHSVGWSMLVQLLEPLHGSGEALTDRSGQRRIAAHEQPHDVHRPQQHIGVARQHLDTALPHCPHEIFDVVG